MTAYTHLSKSDQTIATLSDDIEFTQYGDGSIEFVDVDGNTVNAHSNEELQRFVAYVLSLKAS